MKIWDISSDINRIIGQLGKVKAYYEKGQYEHAIDQIILLESNLTGLQIVIRQKISKKS